MIAMLVAGVLCSAFGAGAVAEDKSYPIRLERPAASDQVVEMRVVVGTRHERRAQVGERALPAKTHVNAVELHAHARVVEHDKRGLEKKMSFEILKCVLVDEGKEEEVLAAGSTVIAEATKEGTRFTLEGGKLHERQEWALGRAIWLSHEDRPTADEYYGTKEAKKVGDSWAINREKIAARESRNGVTVKAEDVEGSMKLVGVEEVDGKPFLRFTLNSDIKRLSFEPPAEGAPKGAAYKDGKRTSSYEGRYAADPKSVACNGTWESSEEMTMEAPGPKKGTVVRTTYVTQYTSTVDVREKE